MNATRVFLRAVRGICLACLAGMLLAVPSRGESVPAVSAESPGGAVALQTANGLLNRGLWDLALAEYRKFLERAGDDHEKSAVARYGLAVCLFRTERWDEAARELARSQERSPTMFPAEVATMLGQCALARGQYAAAAKSFGEVVERHAEHALADDAVVGAAEAHYRAGQFEQALQRASAYMQRWPDGVLRDRAQWWQGASSAALGDHRAAIGVLGSLRARSPGGPLATHVHLMLAQCHQQNGDFAEAERLYRVQAEGGDPAGQPAALSGLGSLYLQYGRAADALAQFDQLLQAHPKSAEASLARLQRARALFELGRFGEAGGALVALQRSEHERADEVLYWLAKCRLHGNDPQAAATLLGEAIERFPTSRLWAEMHYDRAVALARDNHPAAAAEALAVFGERFSDHSLAPDALYLLALCEQRRDRFAESVAHADRVLAGYPDHPVARATRLLRAEARFQTGDLDGVVEDLRAYLANAAGDDEGTWSARYRLGMALYRLDRTEEAESTLSELAQRSDAVQRFGGALVVLAEIYFQRSEWEPARELLERYLAGDGVKPSAEDALLRLGFCHQRMGRPAEALACFDELLRRFPKSPHGLQVQFERGQALISLGRSAEAREVLEQVAQRGAESPFAQPAVHHLGALALREGDFDRAAERFGDLRRSGDAEAMFQYGQSLAAAGKYVDAEVELGRFLETHAVHDRAPAARATLALALARQQKHAEVLKHIAQLEVDGWSQLDPSIVEAVHYEKAWSLRQLGRADEAVAAYRSLLARRGSTPVIHAAMLDLAAMEMDAKRFDEAADWLQKLLSTEGGSAESIAAKWREQARYRLGVCEFERGRYAEASAAFDRLLEEFPQSSLAASSGYFSGEALFRMGRAAQAGERLRRVVEEHPDSGECAAAMLRWGECLAAQQLWLKSEQVLSDFLRRFGEHPAWFQAQFGIGWAQEHQGRHDEAIRAYGKVVARHQGQTAARAQFQIGECHFARKDYDTAVRELLKVDILYAYAEWSAAALFEAGRCFDLMGREQDARVQYKAVIEQYGDSPWAQSAAQRLAQRSTAALPGR